MHKKIIINYLPIFYNYLTTNNYNNKSFSIIYRTPAQWTMEFKCAPQRGYTFESLFTVKNQMYENIYFLKKRSLRIHYSSN